MYQSLDKEKPTLKNLIKHSISLCLYVVVLSNLLTACDGDKPRQKPSAVVLTDEGWQASSRGFTSGERQPCACDEGDCSACNQQIFCSHEIEANEGDIIDSVGETCRCNETDCSHCVGFDYCLYIEVCVCEGEYCCNCVEDIENNLCECSDLGCTNCHSGRYVLEWRRCSCQDKNCTNCTEAYCKNWNETEDDYCLCGEDSCSNCQKDFCESEFYIQCADYQCRYFLDNIACTCSDYECSNCLAYFFDDE